MVTLGYLAALLDVFLRFSRIHDVAVPAQFHIAAVAMALGLAALVLTGRLFSAFTAKTGRLLAWYTFWMMLSIGVSVWPGGAYSYFIDHWLKSVITFFFIVGFIRSFKHLRAIVVTIACACAVVSYLGIVLGSEMGGGRTRIQGLTFGNPNDLAMMILFGTPFCFWAVMNKHVRSWQRLFLLGGMIASIRVLLGTGSRAGLVILVVLCLYAIWRQSAKNRLRIAVLVAVLIPVGFTLIPRNLLIRYATFFQSAEADPISDDMSEEDEVASLSAAHSANSRLEMLKRSLLVTAHNPVLGVGPGMFLVAENELAVEAGKRRGYWKNSHNMYTQVSAEMGIVALFLFLYMIVLAWKALSRAEKQDPRIVSFAGELRSLAIVLKMSTVVFLLAGLTLSLGYGPFLPVLCALAVVVDRLVTGASLPYGIQAANKHSEPVPVEKRLPPTVLPLPTR